MENKELKKQTLAKNILDLAKNTLLVHLRFMDMALNKLILVPYSGSIASDGKHLFYDPNFILNTYRKNKERINRVYLHTILHCVFQHNFIMVKQIDRNYWSLACDIAVEKIISELDLPSLDDGRNNERNFVFDILKNEVKILTAEKLYNYFLHSSIKEINILRWQNLFLADDHSMWYEIIKPAYEELSQYSQEYSNQDEQSEKNSNTSSSSDSNLENKNDRADNKSDNTSHKDIQSAKEILDISEEFELNKDSFSQKNSSYNSLVSISDINAIVQAWKTIAERMQMDLETFQKSKGEKSAGLIQNLKHINREVYDYSSFLKQFAVMGEALKINEDEFDYNFYTYGLKLYNNMPLIEPLEYKELKRIREFVIVIDTSASVEGDTVQRFLQKTYNIFKQEETYFKTFTIYIIQADAKIQDIAIIKNQADFDAYINNLSIKGLGGTDFRPAFEYVNNLIKDKKFINLKGLIYFTDGFGEFPANMQSYKTAFVFLDDELNNYDVPSWAIKLVLKKEDIN